jgi:DNA-binding CsgD family transcriptional regulator
MAAASSNNRGVLRALVADVQPLWRVTFAAMLRRLGVGASAACASAAEFDAIAATLRPHLVVVDPQGLPGIGDSVAAVAAMSPHLAVMAVPSFPDSLCVVSKCSEPNEIEEALHQVIVERLDWATLTVRELEILQLVADGASNRSVARALWLSDQTVKFHLANTYRKLGVSGRHAAVKRAAEIGLLPAPQAPLDADLLLRASGADLEREAHTADAAKLDS